MAFWRKPADFARDKAGKDDDGDREAPEGKARLMEADEAFAGDEQLDMKKAKREVARRPRPAQSISYVREFAHGPRANRKPNDRVDFTETLYWSAAIPTGPNGEATVRFHLADSVTSFKAIAGGYSADGAIGAGEASLESVQPFYLEPKLPLEVSAGDRVQVPLALVNGTSAPLGAARVNVTTGKLLQHGDLGPVSLRAGDRVRQLVALDVGQGSGAQKVAFEGSAGNYTDRVERTISVKPSGFPFEVAFGGMLAPQKPVLHKVTIPEGVAPGSVEFQAAVFPTPLANMTQALSRLIQEPSGCFEQTSSTTYPMTMAQQYSSPTRADQK